jgi:hypothetical protein
MFNYFLVLFVLLLSVDPKFGEMTVASPPWVDKILFNQWETLSLSSDEREELLLL